MYTDNNLFRFATKELSQDAILAWTVNGINGQDESLKALGKALLKAMVGWEGEQDISEVRVLRQVQRIDVLIHFRSGGKQHLVIVEDKVGTGVHDNQLVRYIDTIQDYRGKNTLDVPNDPYGKPDDPLRIEADCIVHPVFVKTGLFTDNDSYAVFSANQEIKEKWSTEEVCSIQTVALQALNTIYADKACQGNLLVRMFSEHLAALWQREEKVRSIISSGDREWAELLKSAEGQWNVMKALTPLAIPIGKSSHKVVYYKGENEKRDYYPGQYSGSSFGTPWTQTCFWLEPIAMEPSKDGDGPFYRDMFWRLDRNQISLKYYVDYQSKKAMNNQGGLSETDIENIRTANRMMRIIYETLGLVKYGKQIRLPEKEIGQVMENALVVIDFAGEGGMMPLAELQKLVWDIHSEFIKLYNQRPGNSISLAEGFKVQPS